ncbi:hypothetical protein HOLleu_25609 [Holothuria leucospilota]|uniref:Uncharacterized protein n=1 Tax=Holothuria leucospilota TaxID=206669 RepID=A0A9Q1BSP1_HOLLE|nr:hypothetical protein HOLleu_25609 [Holothuria leucospilota]
MACLPCNSAFTLPSLSFPRSEFYGSLRSESKGHHYSQQFYSGPVLDWLKRTGLTWELRGRDHGHSCASGPVLDWLNRTGPTWELRRRDHGYSCARPFTDIAQRFNLQCSTFFGLTEV